MLAALLEHPGHVITREKVTAGLREISLPPISDTIAPNIVLAETYAFHAPHFVKMPQLHHAAISRNLREGAEVTTAAYIQSRRDLDEARRAIGTVFSNVDLLVTTTTSVPPPTIEEAVRLGIELEMNRNTRALMSTVSRRSLSRADSPAPGCLSECRSAGRASVRRKCSHWRTLTSKQLTGTRGGPMLFNL